MVQFVERVWSCMTRPAYPILDCLEERNERHFLKLRFGAHSGSNSYYLYSDARVTIIGYRQVYTNF